MKIWGNVLEPQTRALMMACSLSDTDHENKAVDLNEKSVKNHEFSKINPTGSFPLIEHGVFRVLGGSHVVFIFLCKSHQNIGNELLPEAKEVKIKGMLGWQQAKLSIPT